MAVAPFMIVWFSKFKLSLKLARKAYILNVNIMFSVYSVKRSLFVLLGWELSEDTRCTLWTNHLPDFCTNC